MSSHDHELSACLELVRQRDEPAARLLVEKLYPLVVKLVRAHLPRREEPEDLVQEVFMKVFSRLDQYRGEVPFEHWVSRVAVTTCIDRLRFQQRRPVCAWSDLSEEQQGALENLAAETASDDGADRLAYETFAALLDSLPPADRLVLQLLEIEQKSIAEVIAITGWNSGVVRIRAFRARRRLKKLWLKLEKR